jgi:excisionase family DNA binding protein
MAVATIEPALLDEQGAMRYLDVGRTKLRELVRDHELRALRIGRSVKFARVDLDAFIERLRAEQDE